MCRQQIIWQVVTLGAKLSDSPSQIYGVPEHDGGHSQVDSGGAVALVLERAVA